MIRGVYKNIVLLSDLENGMFEQAIFVLKPQTGKGAPRSSDEVLKEARRVVDNYVSRYGVMEYTPKKKKPRVGVKLKERRYLWYAAGAVGISVIGSAVVLLLR